MKHNPATTVVQRDDGSTACVPRERLVCIAAGDLNSREPRRLSVKLPPFGCRLTTSRARLTTARPVSVKSFCFWLH